jgi:hypothetical protein
MQLARLRRVAALLPVPTDSGDHQVHDGLDHLEAGDPLQIPLPPAGSVVVRDQPLVRETVEELGDIEGVTAGLLQHGFGERFHLGGSALQRVPDERL